MAEVVLEVVAVCLRTLKVSFSIFQRARAQWAISATLARFTGRLVTKAPRAKVLDDEPEPEREHERLVEWKGTGE